MKLRILRKKVWVSSSAQEGWKAKSISREKDILQQWDAEKGWVDVPVEIDSVDIFNDSMDVRNY